MTFLTKNVIKEGFPFSIWSYIMFRLESPFKVFQMEILQDSLAERIDKLIKKSSVVDSRLDIIEEELEEQTKISINGTE